MHTQSSPGEAEEKNICIDSFKKTNKLKVPTPWHTVADGFSVVIFP